MRESRNARALRAWPPPGRVFALAFAATIVAAVTGAAARAQELPAPLGPGALRVEDAPNDAGTAIAVVWPAAPGEREAAAAGKLVEYQYVVLVAPEPAPGVKPAPESFIELARAPGSGAWKSEMTARFGPFAVRDPDHAVVLPLLTKFSPSDVAAAGLGDVTATAKLARWFGPDVAARARKTLEENGLRTAEDVAAFPRVMDELGYEIVLDRAFHVRLEATRDGQRVVMGEGAVKPASNAFDRTKTSNVVVMLLSGGAVFLFVWLARKNPNLFLRRIGGLDAIDEALGRATEMGKPVLFVHGLESLEKIPTIAAINILGEVAKKVARYDTKLICTNYDPIVLTVSQETVKEGFLRAGRPDAYNRDDVFLTGAEQFSYVAAVDGIMLRQRPAANIYAGYFYAESLLLAETGASTGAIQIAATDAYTQLPFFVTTCDYTLMGEELYAASAYLSRDPLLLGSLRGQDVGKALVIVYLVLGTIAATFFGSELFKLLVKTT